MFDFIDKSTLLEIKRYLPYEPKRDPKRVAKKINCNLKGAKIALYGAGGHTVELLSFLDTDIQVVVIFDDHSILSTIGSIAVEHISKIVDYEFDYIVISSSFFASNMCKKLKKLGIAKNKIINYYSSRYYVKPDYFVAIDLSNELPKIVGSGKKNIVLIVPFENSDHITRFSSILCQEYNLYKIYYIFGSFGDINQHFTSSFAICSPNGIRYSLLALLNFINNNKANIDLIVVNTISSIFYLPYFIKKIFPDIKVAVSILDFLTSLGSKKKVVNDLECARRYDFEKRCESFVINNSDGIIASVGGKWADDFLFSKNQKCYQIYNYLSKNIFVNIKKTTAAQKPLLCYAGGILPTYSDKSISVDIKMINIIKPALIDGCGFKVYARVANKEEINKMYADYVMLSEKYREFSIEPFLPVEKLVPNIANCDFGVMYYDFTETKKRGVIKHHLEIVLPTKIFTYIAAGLPILISKELKFAHDFIMDHGIGLSVSQSDIYKISSVIGLADMERLKSNIDKFQSIFNIEAKSSEMILALQQILG